MIEFSMNVFLNKNVDKIKNVKTVKSVTGIKKRKKRFLHLWLWLVFARSRTTHHTCTDTVCCWDCERCTGRPDACV